MHLFPFLSLPNNKAINKKVLKRAEFRLEASLAILHPAKILASVANENFKNIVRKIKPFFASFYIKLKVLLITDGLFIKWNVSAC